MEKIITILFLTIFLIGCKAGVVVELPETEGEFGGGEIMADVLLIIAQKDFQPVEYGDTRAELEKAGLGIAVASITTDVAVGADSNTVKPDVAVKDANAADYKAVVVIGGPGAHTLGEHEEVLELLKDAKDKGKVVAAICIAPTILAKAGLLEGKKATVWNGDGEQAGVIEAGGAEFVDNPVVADGKIITGNGPAAAREFGKTIADALK